MKKIPSNIRLMDGHEAHILAAARLARRQRLGAVGDFFANLFKPLRAPAMAPTRFINRFACVDSGAQLPRPSAGLRASAGLAFTLKEKCDAVSEDDAMDLIGSYMPALLVEAMDESGWAFLVCGDAIDADDCEDPYCRTITLKVNDTEIGQGDTDGLSHSVATLVAQASVPVGLEAGEIIFSGAALGCATDILGHEINPRDLLAASIDGLGGVTAHLS